MLGPSSSAVKAGMCRRRNWGTRRSSTCDATAAAAGSDVLDQVVTIFNGSRAQLYRRNGSPVTATSTVAFNIGRLGLGFAGASTYVSSSRLHLGGVVLA
jgi:hypothetical protein